MKCEFCESQSFILKYELSNDGKEIFRLYQCGSCGLVFLYPQPSERELTRYYKTYRSEGSNRFIPQVESLLIFLRRLRVAKLLSHKKRGRILDVGCGRGTEIELLKEKGWRVMGLEYSKSLAELISKDKSIKVISGDLCKLKLREGSFDVISFWHSLEHLKDPYQTLLCAERLLKKRGYLIIAVPNFDSLERKIFSSGWLHLDPPAHLYHFSANYLSSFLKKFGFSKTSENYIAPEYDFFSFAQSILNRLWPSKRDFFYDVFLKRKPTQSAPFFLLSQILIFGMLFMLSLFFVPIFWIFGATGTVEMYFQKR